MPLWYDSDDDRLTVSLAGKAKLRKLRTTASEDLITGREYIKRLRRLYQQLHPIPAWAGPNQQRKRKMSTGSDASDVNGENDIDDEEEDDGTKSTQPLSRLLQDAMSLTRVQDNSQTGRKRKLRQEVLDIQRLKDVGGVQPVSRTEYAPLSGLE